MPVQPKQTHVVVLLALAAYVLLAWRFDFLCDDAYISFRYARNAVEGHGLRYNLTLGDPIEGYTNLLWTLWAAFTQWVGLDMRVVSRLTSAVCGGLLIVWLLRSARERLSLGPTGFAMVAAFAATLPPIAVWATSGLEPMALALVIFGAYDRLLGDPERPRGVQAGVLLAIGALLRADGMVFGGMILGAAVLLLPRARCRASALRAIVAAGVILTAAVVGHMLWRHATYGSWLPNTAKAKAGFSPHRLRRGYEYGVSYLLTVPSLALVLLLSLRRWKPDRAHLWLPSALFVVGTWTYATYVGGDFMPMGRFLLPAVPFIILLFAALCSRLPGRVAGSLGLGLVALNLLACFDVQVVPRSIHEGFHFREDEREWTSELTKWGLMAELCEERSDDARALAKLVKPGETMIMGPIGATGYYTRLDVYDLYGLISPSVLEGTEPRARSTPGHDRRVDYGHFLDRHPTYLGFEVVDRGEKLWARLPRRMGGVPLPELIEIERHSVDGSRELRLYRLK